MDGQNFQNNQEQNGQNQNGYDYNQGYYQDYTNNMQQPQGQYPYNNNQPVQKSADALSIVSLVIGIISILSSFCLVYIGSIIGIPALVCGIIANNKNKNGIAKGGIICGIIGIVLGIVMTVVYVFLALYIYEEMPWLLY